MKTNRHFSNAKRLALITVALFAMRSAPLHAAPIITSAGFVLDEANWDDQGWGSLGFAFFGGSSNSAQVILQGNNLEGNFDINLTANTADAPKSGSVAVQNGSGGTVTPGAVFNVGLNHDNLVNVGNLTLKAGTPSSFRIGILVGSAIIQTEGDTPDFPQSVGINGVEQVVAKPETTIARADWYFFDVSNASEGDTLTFQASRIADVNLHRFNPVNGIVVIPEPSSLLLVAIGLLLPLISFRKLRKNR
ncbi:MAG: PEP-CTERM sorting domain-containing protein [Verrucomicrobia bacterium]|nr:PEP-CTERM sorting domain-containing protein [Verrucomicrobiota bacterium]MCH8526962.1 PEP-CTERM sorting domain-containing protein [Kiritimatiellia bacterium]